MKQEEEVIKDEPTTVLLHEGDGEALAGFRLGETGPALSAPHCTEEAQPHLSSTAEVSQRPQVSTALFLSTPAFLRAEKHFLNLGN